MEQLQPNVRGVSDAWGCEESADAESGAFVPWVWLSLRHGQQQELRMGMNMGHFWLPRYFERGDGWEDSARQM
jgi:hypothetical protein